MTALAGAGNLDFVRDLGAHEIFDYATTSPADLDPFDVVLDTAIGTELSAFHRLLAPRERMVTITFDSRHMLSSLSYILTSTVFGSRRVRFSVV
ncbi:zinc-binding dehydrogenase [Streptosporangium sp. LJ11]|uniref:zinc-binding dehydrogenase n=1 Tax=Streptosporangium sp. LJ11 TaxID=3436927 RepID=UPI003F79BD6C